MQYLSDVIRGWLGWCPNQTVVPVRTKIPGLDANSCVPPKPGTYVNDDVIFNHGKTGISPTYFIGLLIAIIGSIALFILIIRSGFLPQARILFCVIVLPVMIAMVYRDLRKAYLEISPDTLIIHWSLHRLVIIPKDDISSVEIRPNEPSFSLRLQKILILILALSDVGLIWVRYFQVVAGEITLSSFFLNLGADIGVVLFFIAFYYHSRLRAVYPEMLVISTSTQRRVTIYGKNPEKIAKMLGKSV